jgi:hypothetical protein
VACAFAALAFMAACDDDEDDLRRTVVDIRVQSDGLEPSTASVRVPDKVLVSVFNETDEVCDFHFGPWLRGLTVEPDEEAGFNFTVTEVDGERAEMGCADRGLTGTVEVLDATN